MGQDHPPTLESDSLVVISNRSCIFSPGTKLWGPFTGMNAKAERRYIPISVSLQRKGAQEEIRCPDARGAGV